MPDNPPLLDRAANDLQYGGQPPYSTIPYTPPAPSSPVPNLQQDVVDRQSSESDSSTRTTGLDLLNSIVSKASATDDGKLTGGGILNSLSQSKNDRYDKYLPGHDNEAAYAAGQSGWSELGNAAVNLVAKTVAYTSQAAGFILGAPVALVTQDMSNMTDNFLTKAGEYIKEKVQETNPIYKPDNYTNGNIWHKLMSSQWWLDDFVDRAALTISMFLPGMAEAKGIGLFGTVADAAGGTRATGLLTKGIEAVSGNIEGAGDFGKLFLPKLYKAATTGAVDEGVNPALAAYARNLTKAELYSWNVIGQSALNAKETGDGIKKALSEARDRGENFFTDQQIEDKAAEGRGNAFWQTVPLTLAGSLVELPQMFSTARGAKSLMNKIYNSVTGEQIVSSAEKLVPSFLGSVGKSLLTGTEHSINEGLQVAISDFNTEKAKGKDPRGTIDGIFGTFIDKIADPNMDNNLALGFIQGMLMTAGGRALAKYKGEDSHTIAQANSIMEQVANAKTAMRYYNADFTARNEKGQVMTDEKGRVKLDQQKLADAGVSLANMQSSLQQRAQAIHEGNYDKIDELNHKSVIAIARNFFDDPNGMEHFKALVAIEQKTAKDDVNRQKDIDEYGNEIPVEAQFASVIETAEKAKKIYDAIEQRHAGFMHFDVNEKQKDEVMLAKQRLAELKEAQYNEGTNQQYIIDSLIRNTRALTNIATTSLLPTDSKIEKPSNPQEEQINELIDKRTTLTNRLEQSKANYKQLIDKKAQQEWFNDDLGFLRGVNVPDTTEEKLTKAQQQTKEETDAIEKKGKQDAVKSALSDWVNKANESPIIEELVQKHKDVIDPFLNDDKALDNPEELYKLITTLNSDFTEPDDKKNIAELKQALDALVEYTATKQAEEVLKNNKELKEKLDKQQAELSKRAGNVSTGDNETDLENMPREESKKDLYTITHSTTEPSANRKTWHDRHQTFLRKLSTFPNRSQIKAVKITRNNEEAWGLKGLVDSVKAPDMKEEDVTSVGKGIVLVVYVQEDKKGVVSLIDINGKPLTESTIHNTVYGVMSDVDDKWSNGKPKYRSNEAKDAPKAFADYQKQRDEVFKITDKENTKINEFYVADGKPIYDERPEARNPVVGSLVEYGQLNQKGLIQVSTIGLVAFKDQNYNIPKGRPVLVTPTGVQFLNNRTFNVTEAENITNALKQLSKDLTETGSMNPEIVRFLEGNFQWKTPGPNSIVGKNQIYIDQLTGELMIGETAFGAFHPNIIEKNREAITAHLQGVYNNINNRFLTESFDSPFNQTIVDKSGNITTIKWKTYQHYLLSPKLSTGEQRKDNVPLYTRVRMLKSDKVVKNDYNFQRYSVLEDVENPKITTATPIVEKKESPVKAASKANQITLGGGETISYTVKDGVVSLVDSTELNKAIDRVKQLEPEMTNARAEAPGKTDEVIAAAIIKSNIENRIKTEAPTVIDAERADIERRRQKELSSKEWKAKSINAKYDAELDALNKPEVVVETVVEAAPKKTIEQIIAEAKQGAITGDDNSEYRTVESWKQRRMTPSDHVKFSEWMKSNLPNVPVERVMQIIEKTGGGYAWGKFEKGMITLFENAAVGTEYHEAFEAVWNSFLSEAEQKSIINEYKTKNKGSDLSDKDIKERIADTFSGYIATENKEGIGNAILRFFHDIIRFFKSLISKPGATEQLFKRINTGYYSSSEVNDGIDAAYSSWNNTSQQVKNEIIDHNVASIMKELSRDTANFFNLKGNLSSVLFSKAKDDLVGRVKGIITSLANTKAAHPGEELAFDEEIRKYDDILNSINTNWDKAIDETKDFLSAFDITITDDEIDFNDDNRSSVEFRKETFKTDVKAEAPNALKLLFATLTSNINSDNQTPGQELSLPKEATSPTIHGLQTAPFAKSFIQTLEAVANRNTLESMMDGLVALAKSSPNYVKLFTRLRGSLTSGKIDYSKLTFDDWRLLISFYKGMARQKPTALTVYLNGDKVYIGESDLNDATNNTVSIWVPKIRDAVGKQHSLISYDGKKYSIVKGALTPVGNVAQQLSFLSRLGVPFTRDQYNKLSPEEVTSFARAVASIRHGLSTVQPSATLNQKWLGITGPLNVLAGLSNAIENPESSSVFFNINNEMQQKYVLNNYLSTFTNDFNEIKSLFELYERKPYLKDVFSANSQILKLGGLFFDEDGVRTSKPLSIGYAHGIVDRNRGRNIEMSKLTKGVRLMTEINFNMKGWSYNVSGSDSGTEWMINTGNQLPFTSTEGYNEIFNQYLGDEIALIQENRTTNSSVKPKAKKLRMFTNMLSVKTAEGIESAISKGTITEYIADNQKTIDEELDKYFTKKAQELKQTLTSFNEITVSTNGRVFTIPKLAVDKKTFSETELNTFLQSVVINNTINTIELHKLYYGDPYQFEIKTDNDGKITSLDELKRVKSSGSPKELTFNTPEYDNFANEELNKSGDVELTPEDIGYTAFKPYANTVTLNDVKVYSEAYLDELVDETDASAEMSFPFYRQMELKRGTWDKNTAEPFFQYDMARARNFFHNSSDYDYKYSSDALEQADNNILAGDKPVYTVNVIKPLAFGTKYGATDIDLLMDKYSIVPLTFDLADFAGRNMRDAFYKMHFDKASDGHPRDYMVVKSGRKVGAETTDNLYSPDGSITKEPFVSDIKVDLNNIGYQLETAYKEGKKQRKGKQLTRLATMDIYNAGVPIDTQLSRAEWNVLSEADKLKQSNLYGLVKNYDRILDQLTNYGYQNVLKRLGIIDKGNKYEIEDHSILAETLRKELLRRNTSDNVKKAIQLGEDGRFPVAFEATNTYKEIKGVIFSIINDNIISQKLNGGPKTQVSSTMFEKNNRQAVYKTKDGYKNVEDYNSLSEAEKKSLVLTSNELKFYTTEKTVDGKITKVNHMEVYLPRWFKNKSSLSDEEFMNWLNKPENQSILQGIGFRIPTQAKNSIEAFIVKGFLPDSMGDTIILPSEITRKTGSDFDIDKLNTYLKNILYDKQGLPYVAKINTFDSNNEEDLKFFYEEYILENYKKFKLKEENAGVQELSNKLFDKVAEGLNIEDEDEFDLSVIQQLKKDYVPSLEEFITSNQGKSIYDINQEYNPDYKKIIENEFFQATEDLILHPDMFDRLVKPNEGGGKLPNYRDRILKALGKENKLHTPSIIDMEYRATVRHNNMAGDGGIGIVATTQTLYANLQRIGAVIRNNKILIALKHNTIEIDGKKYATLSGLKDRSEEKRYISDNLSNIIDGMVDISKDAYITELLGDNSNVHSTFIFLTLLGVDMKTSSYFLNQPIIREYLKSIAAKGKTILEDKDIKEAIMKRFSPSVRGIVPKTINEKALLPAITKFYSERKDFTNQEKTDQLFILNEFLKYAELASNVYGFNTSASYDNRLKSTTSHDNKLNRANKERQNNIISSIDDVLDNTYMGNLVDKIGKAHDALSEVFITLKSGVRDVLNSVRKDFDIKYMKAKTRELIDEGIERSFIDYVIQTETKYFTQDINKLLINEASSVSTQLENAKIKLSNPFINALASIAEKKGLLSIKLNNKDTDVFTTNLYIAAFRELKQQDRELYNNLVRLAIIQSGTGVSKLSYSHLIPIEDYRLMAQEAIGKIDINTSLDLFKTNNAFSRNNWRNDNIVPIVKTRTRYTDQGSTIDAYDRVPPSLQRLGQQLGSKFIQVHPEFGSNAAYPVLKTVRLEKQANGKNKAITSLYQKVMRDDNTALQLPAEGKQTQGAYIYKQINPWGDSIYLQEYYKTPRQSQYLSDDKEAVVEIPDTDIVAAYDKSIITKPVIKTRIINEKDLQAFKTYMDKSGNIKPNEFFTNSTTFKEFYNKELGKRQQIPQTSKWLLREDGNYNLVDKDTGEVYIENVDLSTGYKNDNKFPDRDLDVKDEKCK